MKLIKEHPSYDAVVDCVIAYTFIAEENPERVDALARTLRAVRDSPDAPMIGGDSTTLWEIYREQLRVLHAQGFAEIPEQIGPTNSFLLTSLLSGISFKYDLLSCSEQYGTILEGLNARPTSPNAEVHVAGACIQLLIAGSHIIPHSTSYFKSSDDIATKLKAQRDAGTVKNENARRILDLAITHAETGFKEEDDVDNVWQLLFPLHD
ncbi:hypothetical protein BDN70DRAFT_925102 [Pholiota conissans]|uniref:Uncharacterized protein n=1 Tax=Pholiota conissans TaxID=109636 RepID=A0A9P6CP45_9AGAR|nr:hypothetical protein BDN70DRAFT_925102 [Pholiota conissans]